MKQIFIVVFGISLLLAKPMIAESLEAQTLFSKAVTDRNINLALSLYKTLDATDKGKLLRPLSNFEKNFGVKPDALAAASAAFEAKLNNPKEALAFLFTERGQPGYDAANKLGVGAAANSFAKAVAP